MTKKEIDAIVLEVYLNYPAMNEDLKSDIIVWLMENANRYDNTVHIDFLVQEAKTSIAESLSRNADALNVDVRRKSRGVDSYYDLCYAKSVQKKGNEDEEA